MQSQAWFSETKGHQVKLFQYAIILHPEKKSSDKSKLIVGLKDVLAKDQAQASIMAARDIPEEHLENLDRIEVLIRPF